MSLFLINVQLASLSLLVEHVFLLGTNVVNLSIPYYHMGDLVADGMMYCLAVLKPALRP